MEGRPAPDEGANRSCSEVASGTRLNASRQFTGRHRLGSDDLVLRNQRSEGSDMANTHGQGPFSEGWGTAFGKALLLLIVAVVGFILVPNQLLQYLPTHGVAPRTRDVIVAGWALAWFVAASYLFVRIQPRRST